MANTIGSTTWREKYFQTNLALALHNALVAEKICSVDTSESYLVKNPYGSAPTTVVQPMSGTYSAANWTSTNDTLTVAEEFIVSEQIMDFESLLSNFPLMQNRLDEMMYSVATAVDLYVLNVVLEAGTGTYTTPVGGFTTASNINVIMGNLISKVAGYNNAYSQQGLVIENTDVPGFIQAQATNGFNFADRALNNGLVGNYMGVNIYVVRTGTFTDATQGSQTWTNVGHRLFLVEKVCATYASPRGIKYEEKQVSGKTGREVFAVAYCGAKVWAPKATLVIDITLA